ncbi:MAG: hypothetical protein KatS3mg005_0012 [Bryobacteraceae bacterium]|nr:MAG: hypothetical protein KatS3mg005_0012 [Bryobacteraceae bacterium]
MRYLGLLAVFLCAHALGQVQIVDTLRVGAGNGLFEGRIIVTGPSMVCGGHTYAPWPLEVQVTNGQVNLTLVPSSACEPQGVYTVRFLPARGSEWTERWIVPNSSGPLTLAQVPRATLSTTSLFINPAQIARSGAQVGDVLTWLSSGRWGPAPPGTGSVSLAGDVTGPASSTIVTAVRGVPFAPSAPIEGQVFAWDSAQGSMVPRTINGAYADGEVPAGVIDGSNRQFSLSKSPQPAASLMLYRNGILQRAGVDFTLSGQQITFCEMCTPVPGDVLLAYYRWAPSLPFGSQVLSVAGKAGEVTLDVGDIANLEAILDGKAPLVHDHDGRYPRLDGTYVNPSWISSLAWPKITGISGTPDGTKFLRDDGSWQTVSASATWGAITGTLSSQADLQAALDGKAAASHNHPLSDLSQSGALSGQVIKWDGSSWVAAPDETGGAPSWGSITGTLSNQADLQTALDGKAALSHSHDAAQIATGILATARLGSGTAGSGTFLRGDQQWAAVDWAEVVGKPSSFPPVAHGHSAADITSGTIDPAPLPKLKHVEDVTSQTSVNVAAATHQLGAGPIQVTCYTQSGSSWEWVIPDQVLVSATGDVQIQFLVSFTGKCVLQ